MYDEQILRILLGVGVRGISTKKLAKHVYNHFCTFFHQPDFDDIYRYVKNYLRRNSRSPKGLIKRADRWGHYRLNTANSSAIQTLMAQYKEKEEKEESETPKNVLQDLSLSLFD